ncbi:hypothetical protein Tco_1020952 [Tanacetum coccineum]
MQDKGQSLDYSHQSSPSIDTPLEPNLFSTIRQNNSSSSSVSTYSQTLRSETSAFESTVHQTSSSSAPSMDEQDEIDENYEMTLLSEAEIIDRDGNFLRTQTMTTKEVYKLNEGEMIVVPFNDLNQPIKSAAGLFTRFMTLLVKEPKLCPLDAKNWKECKKRCGLKLIMELRRRFDFPRSKNVDDVVFSHLRDKFRTLKHRIKKSLLALAAKRLHEANNFDGEMQYTDDEILQALDLVEAPHYFVDHQWESYKDHLRAPKTKSNSQYMKRKQEVAKSIFTLLARLVLPRKRMHLMRRQGVSSENRFLLNKVAEQSKQIEKQSRKMNMMEENMTKFIGELKTMLPDLIATRTSKTQLFYGSCEDRT